MSLRPCPLATTNMREVQIEISERCPCRVPDPAVALLERAEAVNAKLNVSVCVLASAAEKLAEALRTMTPLAERYLRFLRARNNPDALMATNNIADARDALADYERSKGK